MLKDLKKKNDVIEAKYNKAMEEFEDEWGEVLGQ
jgi:hypothetical protein